jgi:hypothetical protein
LKRGDGGVFAVQKLKTSVEERASSPVHFRT